MMRFFCVSILVLAASAAIGQSSLGHLTTGGWDLYLSNSGGLGRDSLKNGGMWPRGSADLSSYLHGSGFWFGCERASDTSLKLVEMTVSPHNVPVGSGQISFSPLLRAGESEPVYSST